METTTNCDHTSYWDLNKGYRSPLQDKHEIESNPTETDQVNIQC